ncbi:hypothetical protein B0H63DRAFT_221262 [Podospora didyma]|uniref:Uncharacterized protein n=1 Tax=Podospora didyma TaxID=330526 RepID=A0AAE0KJ57_9PEZI|nr:hypothetical protein B0H63DRAFT_221262 [Podospora didyma]
MILPKTLITWLPLAVGNVAADPAPPAMNFLYSVNLTFNALTTLNIGNTSMGRRVAYPISGGTFVGPNMIGKALYGLDWGLSDFNGAFREDTVYYLQTDDGALIYVRANGIRKNVHHVFETSSVRYAWLNTAVGFAQGRQFKGGVGLDVWQMGI